MVMWATPCSIWQGIIAIEKVQQKLRGTAFTQFLGQLPENPKCQSDINQTTLWCTCEFSTHSQQFRIMEEVLAPVPPSMKYGFFPFQYKRQVYLKASSTLQLLSWNDLSISLNWFLVGCVYFYTFKGPCEFNDAGSKKVFKRIFRTQNGSGCNLEPFFHQFCKTLREHIYAFSTGYL